MKIVKIKLIGHTYGEAVFMYNIYKGNQLIFLPLTSKINGS